MVNSWREKSVGTVGSGLASSFAKAMADKCEADFELAGLSFSALFGPAAAGAFPRVHVCE
jgi:hypothetical protein